MRLPNFSAIEVSPKKVICPIIPVKARPLVGDATHNNVLFTSWINHDCLPSHSLKAICLGCVLECCVAIEMADLGCGEMKKNSNIACFGDYGRGISASGEDAPLC